MSKIYRYALLFILFVSTTQARIWTNIRGETFDGELREIDDNVAVIRREKDGRIFRVPIHELSEEDKQYLAQQNEKGDSTGEVPSELPSSKEELEKWIIGTEWSLEDDDKKCVRIYPQGVMLMQPYQTRWDKKEANLKRSYRITDKKTMQFGIYSWIATFSDTFKSFKYTNGKFEGKGRLLGRFDITKE